MGETPILLVAQVALTLLACKTPGQKPRERHAEAAALEAQRQAAEQEKPRFRRELELGSDWKRR